MEDGLLGNRGLQDNPVVTQYLIIRKTGTSKSGKTEVWSVASREGTGLLGIIKWFGRWRQYAFFPVDKTIYNNQCLQDIQTVLTRLNKEHSKKVRR